MVGYVVLIPNIIFGAIPQDLPNNFTKVPNGQLKNISLYGNSAMGTNSANQIWYTQNIFAASPTWYILNGNLNSVYQSLMACGLDQNQKVWCNIPAGWGL